MCTTVDVWYAVLHPPTHPPTHILTRTPCGTSVETQPGEVYFSQFNKLYRPPEFEVGIERAAALPRPLQCTH